MTPCLRALGRISGSSLPATDPGYHKLPCRRCCAGPRRRSAGRTERASALPRAPGPPGRILGRCTPGKCSAPPAVALSREHRGNTGDPAGSPAVPTNLARSTMNCLRTENCRTDNAADCTASLAGIATGFPMKRWIADRKVPHWPRVRPTIAANSWSGSIPSM